MTAPLPPSLYADTARPAPPTPMLDGDKRVSVAVIGGGFTGLSAALHLAERGVDVAVLEANEPGWGASGRNGGQVNPGLKHDPDVVEQDFGSDLGRRMVALSGNAPNVVFGLIQRHQIECQALQSGTLRAAVSQRAAAGIRATAAQWARRDAPVELLDAAALRQVTGSTRYATAVLDRRGGQVNPLGYARGLAQAAMQAGAAVFGGTPARRAQRNGAVWEITTPTSTVRAEKLVLATNAYSDDLWPGLRRSVVPVFSAIVASEPLPEALAREIMPARSVLYEMGSVTVYYRLDRDNRLLMGGRCVQRDITDLHELRYLSDYAVRLWPALRGIRWTHAWSGQLAVTRDHYPHIHEPHDDALVCLGYNGRGVAMSTALGPQLARRVIDGRAAEFDMPITTMREIPFHALWRSAVTARMVHGRVRDWLGL
ncbi:MAG TPA: FAD-binding oxidoreductase [Acetobacteraceae bacterium]|nr:FAD-binding oxidoreductase [Acetobacteraceae bacterium]